MPRNSSFVYDRSLKELFSKIPTNFIKLLIDKEIKEILDTNFPSVHENKADLVAKLEDDTVFHLEIQSTNDKNMPLRMIKYALLIYEKYKIYPKQLVLYIGDKKLNTPNHLSFEKLSYSYDVKNIKDFDCTKLIESENIDDNIIAVLCNVKDIDKLFVKLQQKLYNLSDKKREDYLRKFIYLLRLRPKLEKQLQVKKENKMPFVIEKETDLLYNEGIEKGMIKVIKNFLDILDDETISKRTGVPIEKIKELRKNSKKEK